MYHRNSVKPGAIPPILVVLAASGCTKPIPKGHDSYDPTGRINAILETAERRDTSRIPDLIRSLDSDDSAVRLTAIRTLERLTGQTLGYHYAAPESERRAAADRWVQWYQEQQGTSAGAMAAPVDHP